MTILWRVNSLSFALRSIGNRFRRVPNLSENIFVDMEQVRFLYKMNPEAHFVRDTEQYVDRKEYNLLSKDQKEAVRKNRAETIASEIDRFLTKYNLESKVKVKYRSDKTVNIVGTYNEVKYYVDQLEKPVNQFDVLFVTELSKSLPVTLIIELNQFWL